MGPLDLLGSKGFGERGETGGGGEVEQADSTVRHGGRCVWPGFMRTTHNTTQVWLRLVEFGMVFDFCTV